MKLLIDTNLAIWFITEDMVLPKKIKTLRVFHPSEIYI
jgi:PIN domain nuclease of toxin-antitoxin system